jgi:hypothetical protein
MTEGAFHDQNSYPGRDLATALLAVTLLGGGTAGAAGDAHVGADAAPAVTWVTVPDVINQSEANAVAQLTLLGFSIRSDHEYTTIVCTQPVPRRR